MGKHIFISYRSVERAFAKKLAETLLEKGYPIWMDRMGGIVPGDDWQGQLESGVNDAFALIPALSRNYLDSTWCLNELKRAAAQNIPVIPVKIGEFPENKIPIVIQTTQYQDFSGWEGEAAFQASVEQLLIGIKKHTGHEPGARQPQPEFVARAPYRTDMEDKAAEVLATDDETKSSMSRVQKIKFDYFQKQVELAEKQYVAALEEYSINIDPGTLVRLEAQKDHYEKKILDLIEQQEQLQRS